MADLRLLNEAWRLGSPAAAAPTSPAEGREASGEVTAGAVVGGALLLGRGREEREPTTLELIVCALRGPLGPGVPIVTAPSAAAPSAAAPSAAAPSAKASWLAA